MEFATANIRQALRNNAASLRLPVFWRWWTSELATLVPAAPRTALKRRRLRPVLAFEDGAAVLWVPRAVDGVVGLTEVARVSLEGDAAAVAHAGRTAIETLPQRVYGGMAAAARVVVALASGQILRKQLTLPAAVEEDLKEALAYDLDRLTPFRADQLYFDAVVIARNLAKKEIRVDWAGAQKTMVDQARRYAEAWGATVVSVTPETLESTPGSVVVPPVWSKLNLLPDDERPDHAVWRRWQFWLPVSTLALAAMVAVALPLWQKRDYVIVLAQITEQARVKAAASDALRQQLDHAAGDYNFALEKKYAYPSAVQLLEDVTRILPDDTWLTQLEMKSMPKGKEPHREIVLRGESANAGQLVSKLEQSNLFEQAAPRSPFTKIQPGPGEVFDLGAQLKASPRPQPVLLARRAPPAPAAAPTPSLTVKDAAPAEDAAAAAAGAAAKDARAGRDARPGRDAKAGGGTRARRHATAGRDAAAAEGAGAPEGTGAPEDATAPEDAGAAEDAGIEEGDDAEDLGKALDPDGGVPPAAQARRSAEPPARAKP